MSTNTETKQNPLEHSEGLHPIDEMYAGEYREDYDNAYTHRRNLRDAHKKDYSRTFGREMREIIEEVKAGREVRRTIKNSKQHYQANKGAYQEQAVKDAAKEGVHINR